MKRLVLVISIVAAMLMLAAPARASGYPPKAPSEAPPAEVVELPEVPAPRAALPLTGDGTSLPLARAAVLMVAAGGVLVLAVRRRHAGLV